MPTVSESRVELARITLFPIKSLDGVEVSSAELVPDAGLAGDREYALVDDDGRLVNAKRTAEVHRIRAVYAPHAGTVSLAVAGLDDDFDTFELPADSDRAAEWFSDFFGFRVHLARDLERGFPDDPERGGPTVLSTATVALVASWFEGMSAADVRARFRANLELTAPEPFWEERLLRADGRAVPFAVGGAELAGIAPCVRCVVPGRDARDGRPTRDFERRFMAQRAMTLPDFVDQRAFETLYSLTLNTRVTGERRVAIAPGDAVAALSAA